MHRIGRTGRAGRSGEAILFVTPRERGMLRAIERATRQPIEPMELPSVETVNDQRVSKFLGRITTALEGSELAMFRDLVERYEREHNVPAVEIAAALAKLVQGDMPLLLQATAQQLRPHREDAGFGKTPFGNKSSDGSRSTSRSASSIARQANAAAAASSTRSVRDRSARLAPRLQRHDDKRHDVQRPQRSRRLLPG